MLKTLHQQAAERLAKYKFGCVMADISLNSDVAAALKLLQSRIAAEDLVGKGFETDPHITVRYGIMDSDTEALKAFIALQSPFQIHFGLIRFFPPTKQSDNAAVLYVEIDSPHLKELNEVFPQYANFKDADFEYHPHCTLAYIKPEAAIKYIGQVVGEDYIVTNMTVAPRTGEADVVELVGTEALAKAWDESKHPRDSRTGHFSSRWTLSDKSYTMRPERNTRIDLQASAQGIRWGSQDHDWAVVDSKGNKVADIGLKLRTLGGRKLATIDITTNWNHPEAHQKQPTVMGPRLDLSPGLVLRAIDHLFEVYPDVQEIHGFRATGSNPGSFQRITRQEWEHRKRRLRGDFDKLAKAFAQRWSAWIGVDLDGTLAYHDPDPNGKWDPMEIGAPVPAMVEKVKAALAEGKTVKIFTARIAQDADTDPEEIEEIEEAIWNWCEQHIGERLEVTNQKDPGMVELWDDRARRVKENEGTFTKSVGRKARKDGALYTFVPAAAGRYQCDQCVFFGAPNKCSLFGEKDAVLPTGTCSYWTFGNAGSMFTQPQGLVTPSEAGYVENKAGFSCGRCSYFNEDREDCLVVDKDSEGATPGKIISVACCGNWSNKTGLSKGAGNNAPEDFARSLKKMSSDEPRDLEKAFITMDEARAAYRAAYGDRDPKEVMREVIAEQESAFEKAFDPDQRRNKKGQWAAYSDMGIESRVGSIKDKSGKKYRVLTSGAKGSGRSFSVWDGKQQIAHAITNSEDAQVEVVGVVPKYRRLGIASALYDHIEQTTGKKLRPSETLEPDGKMFWHKRKQKKVAKALPVARHTTFQDLPIAIENDTGSTRSGLDHNGSPWSVTMTWPYGYIEDTEGVDGDAIDCFVGPNLDALDAYIIHTSDLATTPSGYDEDKVMLGWDTPEAAVTAFLDNYSGTEFFRGVETVSMADFKEGLQLLFGDGSPVTYGVIAMGKTFDPSQSRDEQGRWSKVGSGKLRGDVADYFRHAPAWIRQAVFSPMAAFGNCDACADRLASELRQKGYKAKVVWVSDPKFDYADQKKGSIYRQYIGGPPTHNVVLVDDQYIVDVSGAQFGRHKGGIHIAPKAEYLKDWDWHDRNINAPKNPFEKSLDYSIPAGYFTPAADAARKHIAEKICSFLSQVRDNVLAGLGKGEETGDLAKAKPPKSLLNRIINIDWTPLADSLQSDLADAAHAGVAHTIATLKITDDDLINSANGVAADWAAQHAAEMIGMRRTADGKLVPNPDASWRIDDSTRDEISELVTQAFEADTPIEDLADSIQNATAFSDYRSEMIARTEVASAQNIGNLEGYKVGGVEKVNWNLSQDHDPRWECNCAENAKNSPYPINNVPPFPGHPNCWCTLSPA